jgi:hypothetical protein
LKLKCSYLHFFAKNVHKIKKMLISAKGVTNEGEKVTKI